MNKKHKRIFCILLIVAIVVGYALCYIVPYFQTFGQGYVYVNNFYASFFANTWVPDYPNRCLTLDGKVLQYQLDENGNPICNSRVIARIPLTPLNFDNLFSGGDWTHYDIDAKWLRQNSDAAWLGFRLDNGKIFWQYILKLNNGDVVVCYGAPLFTVGTSPFRLGFAEYYSPCGTIQEFYDHLANS